jgi:ferric-dicitrate binding protein FerR (iron transport regulator)
MSTQDAQLLLQRYLAGECTAEEKELLEAWWDELQAEFQWQMADAQQNAVHDRMLSRIKAELGEELGTAEGENSAPGRRLPWRRYAGIAAAVLMIAAGGWFWRAQYVARHGVQPEDDSPITIEAKPGGDRAMLTLGNGKIVVLDSVANGMMALQGQKDRIMKQDGLLDYQRSGTTANDNVVNTLAVPRGGQYKLILADGTRVWLDAASSITYPTAFVGKMRQVSITGQAYFEVAHNPNMPFEVKVQGQTIRDVGTAFNIYAYADEPAMKVTLASGAVAVSGPGGTMVGVSKPGQQAEYRDGQLQPLHETDLTSVLAWKNGLFNFTSANIAAVMRQVGRWYDVDIQFDKDIPDGHITGEIPRNTMLSTALQVLRTSGVHFTAEGKTIHVMP